MSSDKGKTYGFWLEFFRNAGILPGFDSKYALVFEDNRIKPDMMCDLTKECLRDMEITAMGDIIAILRYAKVANEQSKTLAFGKIESPPVTNAAATSTVPSETPVPTNSSQAKSAEKVTTTTPALTVETKEPKETVKAIVSQGSGSKKTVIRSDPDKKKETTVTSNTEASVANKDTSTKEPGKVQKRFIIVNHESSSDSDMVEPIAEKRPRDSSVSAPKKKISSSINTGVSGSLNIGPAPSVSVSMSNSKTDVNGVFARLGRTEGIPCVSGEATIIRPTVSSSISKLKSTESSVFRRLGGTSSSSGSTRDSTSTESTSHRLTEESDRHRRPRDTVRQEDPSRRTAVAVGADRRITLSQKPPERRSSPGTTTRVSRDYRGSQSASGSDDRRSSSSRGKSVTSNRITSQGKYSRSDSNVQARLGSKSSANEEPKGGRRKTIQQFHVKNSGDLRVGQVLQSRIVKRSDGTSVTRRLVVKRVPRRHFRRDMDVESDSDD